MRSIHLAVIVPLASWVLVGCQTTTLPTDPIARAGQEQAAVERSVREALAPLLDRANTKLAAMAGTVFTQTDDFSRATVFIPKPPAQNKEQKPAGEGYVARRKLALPEGAQVATWTDHVVLAHRLDAQYHLESIRVFRQDSLAEPYAASIEFRAAGRYWSELRTEREKLPSPPAGMAYWGPQDRPWIMFGSSKPQKKEHIRPLPVPKLGAPAASTDPLVSELRRELERSEPVEINDTFTRRLVYSVEHGRWIEHEDRPAAFSFRQIRDLNWFTGLPEDEDLPVFRPERLDHEGRDRADGAEVD